MERWRPECTPAQKAKTLQIRLRMRSYSGFSDPQPLTNDSAPSKRHPALAIFGHATKTKSPGTPPGKRPGDSGDCAVVREDYCAEGRTRKFWPCGFERSSRRGSW